MSAEQPAENAPAAAPDFVNNQRRSPRISSVRGTALDIALTIRFLLELALLAGAAVVGWHAFKGPVQLAFAILLPLLVAIFWGLFLSPKAKYSLHWVLKVTVEAALFLGVGLWLHFYGYTFVASIGGIVWAVDRSAIWALRRFQWSS